MSDSSNYNEEVRQFGMELAMAVGQVVAESETVAGVIGRIKAAGYRVEVGLAIISNFERQEEAPPIPELPEERRLVIGDQVAPRAFAGRDSKFLQELNIRFPEEGEK
jgi:hypothetical protein